MSNFSSSDIPPLQALSEELCARSCDLILRSEQVQGRALTALEYAALRVGTVEIRRQAEELRQMAMALRKSGGGKRSKPE
jgi:hypothetical protein